MPSSSIAGVSVGRRPSSLGPFAQTLLFTVLFALLIQFAVPIEYDVCPEESSALIENGTEYQCSSADDALCAAPYSCDNSTSFCCGQPLNAEELQPEVDDAELLQPEVDDAEELHPEVDEAQSLLISEEDHTRYCGSEGRILRENNQNVKCTIDSDCLPPAICKEEGFCCLVTLDQEPPPVGCPLGTRSLKNSAGVELSCNPNVADSCPGGTMCYEDSLDGTKRCCGKDPGEGCPSGSKAVKTNEQVTPCTPGSASNACPGNAICQWSYLIDRYQCCQPDNGCPDSYAPIRTNGVVQACTAEGSTNSCPSGATCRFNFWSASFQCCALSLSNLCSVGRVPFLEPGSTRPRQCTTASSNCPSGYSCDNSQQVCCGAAGTCPNGQQANIDDQGRLNACSPSSSQSCPSGSTCQAASGGAPNQYLCCTNSFRPPFACASGRQPYPNTANPQQCSLSDPFSCMQPSQCENSATPGINICCIGSGAQGTCPAGWVLQNGALTYCNPTTVNSCTGSSSSCLRMATAQQFICCTPASSTAQYSCAFGTPILTSTGQNSFCSVTNRCNAPDTCQQATGFPSVYICCRSTDTSASYTCPNSGTPEYLGAQQRTCTISNPTCGNGYFCQQSLNNPMRICCTIGGTSAQFTCPGSFGSPALNNGINVFCNVGLPSGNCPIGATCQTSANDPTASICCYGTSGEAVYTCPNGAQAQSGVGGLPYAICNIAAPLSQCNIGYTCSRAANNIQVAICCAGQLSSVPICPSQAVLLYESGRPKYCSQLGAACPTGYSCRETINIPGSYVCCSSGTALTCPINYAPTTDTRGNPTFCTQSNPSVCPGGSSCMQSASTPSAFICCRSTASEYVCPNNQNALVGSNGQVQVCTGPGSPCSRAGYTCQVSATFGVFVCCGRDATAATCADGRETYTQTPGVTYDCNPLQAPSRCPVNFDCALSNVAGTSVCCRRSTTSSSATCPAGWNPFLSEIDSSMRFCQGPLDVNCPVGYSCTQSSSQNVFICCRLTSTALRCYNGAAVYMVSGQTRLCSQSASNCPNGYACQESTAPNVYVCCQTQSQPNVLCVDNSLPSTIGGSPQYCSPAGSTTVCPSGFICSASTRVGFNVCCRTNIINPPSSTNACGPNAETYIVNQGPYRCSSNPDSCPALYTCQQSVIDNERYCCRNAQCPNGLTIGLAPTICSPTSNICTAGFSCQQSSNIPGVSLCCPSGTTGGGTNVGAARCLGRSTQLVGSQAVSCTIPSFGCALGFECSAYTTSGAYICCAVQVDPGTGSGTGSCPSNRDPYRDPNTRQMLYCDSTDFTCPTGYVCKREQSSSNRYVCCSPIPYCQTGWTPFIDATTQQAQRCLPSQLNQQCPSVGAAYRCQLSTVPGVHVCCQEAIGSRAIGTGADVPPEANLTTITKLPMPTATDDEDWFVFEG